MTDKAHIQKVYEKLAMVKEATPASINVMLATDQFMPSFVLMVGNVPIAEFLHEPNDLLPDFEKSEEIRELFKSASKVDNREDFNEVSPAVTEVFDRAGYESIKLV